MMLQNGPDIEESELYEPLEDGGWYFFTPRDRKFRNGNRINRSTGSGHWQATGISKSIVYDETDNSLPECEKREIVIGHKKSLVFYEGMERFRNKTKWIMQEYLAADIPKHVRQDENDMKLDDWVLCKIYIDKQNAAEEQHSAMNDDYQDDDNQHPYRS